MVDKAKKDAGARKDILLNRQHHETLAFSILSNAFAIEIEVEPRNALFLLLFNRLSHSFNKEFLIETLSDKDKGL